MGLNLRVLGRPLFESGLIIFSVLFALFVNRCAENQRIEEQKEVALERIVEELKSNRELIKDVMQVHREAVANLRRASTDENDSLRLYLARERFFDQEALGFLISGRSFFPSFPSSTSWNAAKSTAIIAEFDYEIVEALTKVYTTQEFFSEKTLTYIIQIIYSPVTEDERDTINALLLQTSELISQEEFTLQNIEEALEVIEGGEKDSSREH